MRAARPSHEVQNGYVGFAGSTSFKTRARPRALRLSTGCVFGVGVVALVGLPRQTSPVPSPDPIHPRPLQPLTGSEPLLDGTVADFWRWALSDLRMNLARGYLVEYLVARALGDPSAARVEWGPWDVQAADGTLVEIKACGRLQSWTTKKLSTPSWSFRSVRADRTWSDAAGDYLAIDPASRVHVWVFALQTAEDPAAYDPLDVEQWEFRVMPHRELLAAGQASARLSFFDSRGVEPVDYSRLAEAVREARRRNDAIAASD
jgi:hypothetical protein